MDATHSRSSTTAGVSLNRVKLWFTLCVRDRVCRKSFNSGKDFVTNITTFGEAYHAKSYTVI